MYRAVRSIRRLSDAFGEASVWPTDAHRRWYLEAVRRPRSPGLRPSSKESRKASASTGVGSPLGEGEVGEAGVSTSITAGSFEEG